MYAAHMRVGSLIPVSLMGGALLAVLAWNDVLPGGWTLRGWITPHAEREALEQAVYSASRMVQIEELCANAPPGAIAFLGSSTIERFPLAELFPDKNCLNLGIGNESTSALIDRLERSVPVGIAGAVLYVGSIDFRDQHRRPEGIAALAGEILDQLRAGSPELPLALIGVLPEQSMDASFVRELGQVNAVLLALCHEKGCAFVATSRPPITDASGSLNPEVAADRLHLGPEGYSHLARWLTEDGGALGQLLQTD
ncbi:hypothetical protein CMO84_00345 [Candidatus Woesearchaeota archaeon]|nr:hypothetical protein [Candidatus Woesearchaeota archaeon]